MPIQPMALAVQNPEINAVQALGQGVQTAQTIQNNSLVNARQALQNIGSLAFGVLGGDLNGQADPQRWEQALDMLASTGMDVEAYRGRSDLAPVVAKASVDALGQMNHNLSERELEQRIAEFSFTVEEARKGPPPTADMQNFALSQQDPAFAEYLAGKDAPNPPSDVAEYNFYAEQEKAAGREPASYLEFIQAQKGGGTTLSVDPATGAVTFTQGSTKFNQTVDAGLGESYTNIQNEALSAMTGLNTLDAMEQTMADPSFYSGFGSDQVLGLKRAAAAIGIDPEGVTSMESFNALAKQSALDLMGGSLGTGFSNADRDFINQQVPNLENTPEGNAKLIAIQRKIAERKIEIADLAEQYRLAHGKLDGGFTTMLAEWSEQNPLFGQGSTASAADPLGILGGS